ncbi:hypothetical protein TYRP_005862 [Tyrophagus putrescentiae]|nr:hypothetical protein TYRP_005862 [Tyrophagus putrescentiae]
MAKYQMMMVKFSTSSYFSSLPSSWPPLWCGQRRPPTPLPDSSGPGRAASSPASAWRAPPAPLMTANRAPAPRRRTVGIDRAFPGGACGRSGSGLVCCNNIRLSCGATTSKNESFFVNPNYPSYLNSTATCQITVASNPGICQIRLDFEDFELAQPDEFGRCTQDSFMVRTTVGERLPMLCGENKGQHITTDRLRIRFERLTTGAKIDGKSRYLSNLRYSACIRVEENFCSIKWTTESADSFSWGVANDPMYNAQGNNTKMGLTGAQCNDDDYVGIDQGSQEGSGVGEDRFCGQKLFYNNLVISRSKPFMLKVRSNSDQSDNNRFSQAGAALTFTQLPCSV